MEDTLHYFNLYYGGSQSIAFVFHRPHEYYNILNNFAAWCISQIDVCLQGYAYRIFSVGLSVVTSACLVFTNLYVTPVIILLIPLVLGLSGMNHLLYYATITFQMYVVVVLLLCLMFFKAPRSRFLFYLAGAVCLLLVWSGPFSVVALPVAFLFLLLFNEKQKNLLLVWLLFCVLIYTSTSQGLVQIGNLFDIRVVSKYCTVMIDKVLLFQLFDRGNLYIALIVAASLSLCVFHLRNERNYLKYSVIFLSIVLLGPVPLFLSVRIARFPEPYPCHLLISQFFWLAWLLFTADMLIRKHWRNRELWILLPMAFIALVTVDNFLHPERRTLPLLPETQAFLCAVSNAEKLQLEKKDRYVVLSYGKGKFTAIARVGSHGNGAERLGKDGIADESIRRFVRE
ncbi:MAG: hypothetical protein LJE65_01070 [Desulfobacteraceae bacterium]|nr:hypothetical protein [Desulfobacteraceae bacterium]